MTTFKRPLRVLLAKLGMDTHTVGVTVIGHALREAGMEVIFTGLKQTPEMVCAAAVQEDVDVVGISTLSAGHTRSLPKLARLLREAGASDKLLVAGGVIPEEDKPILEEAGVDRIFTMGSDTRDIVAYLESWWAQRPAEDAA
ncbi:putative isobutyryl-CoA mutase [Sphingobium herbicidovorans NBRC 16415]|uniref:Isobutyryl-CoA mutase n=1 Tax=Sphingobium herbicidovorans (strain ATCC 700291 / DSM 11019 / CCUG 56400 / KCTC 2939 / LMG 18315 / NBRC 16415 / MH) TaxID=1219045 RepID=A0A086P611_SPHHM|nr:cobalamin B12-binding domain-containing protein [Sphingobium herbicidovorans]KFG88829.1 putative isobutyryl-CoA mutase [Sphingobium herbicidovorans NBRC 16415]